MNAQFLTHTRTSLMRLLNLVFFFGGFFVGRRIGAHIAPLITDSEYWLAPVSYGCAVFMGFVTLFASVAVGCWIRNARSRAKLRSWANQLR